MNGWLPAAMLAAVAAMGAVAALASGASAAPVEVGAVAVSPEGLIEPEVGSATVSVLVSIDCTEALKWTGGGLVTGQVVLRFEFAGPDWAVVSGERETAADLTDCKAAAPRTEHEANFTVQVQRAAPGGQTADMTVRVTASAASPTAPGEEATAEGAFPVRPGYFVLLQVKADEKVRRGDAGAEIEFPLQLVSHGNARVRIDFSLDGRLPAGWQAVPPPPAVLGPSAEGAAPAEAVLRVRSPPGAGRSEAALALEATPVVAEDSAFAGETVVIHLLARAEGFASRTVPGAGPLLVLGVAAAAWRRR